VLVECRGVGRGLRLDGGKGWKSCGRKMLGGREKSQDVAW